MPELDLSLRSSEPEIMDDLSFSDSVVFQTLKELDVINKWLGGNSVTIAGLDIIRRKYLRRGDHLHIADLGCGSGTMLKMMVEWGRKNGIRIKVTGVDANPHIINYAESECDGYPEISFLAEDVFSEKFSRRKFDVVTSTLFFHHFDDSQLLDLFSQLKEQSLLALVINDLHRHWFAYHSISLLTAAFSSSYMVKNDARLSVARSFQRPELQNLLSAAGFSNVFLKWKWAFRYLAVAEK